MCREPPSGRTWCERRERDAPLSRRALLATGGVTLASPLAGCIYYGPFDFARLEVSVRESFDAEPPVTVPTSVDVTVQGVESKGATLHGVTLVCYDAARRELASEPLGDFSWRGADAANRETETYDTGWLSTTTAHRAEWTEAVSLEVDAVPEWLSFRAGDVWFEERRDEGASQGVVVGTARATQPPPPLEGTAGRFASERPATGTVAPDEFRRAGFRSDVPVDESLLPSPSAARLWHARSDDRRKRLEAAVESFEAESSYRIEPSRHASIHRAGADVPGREPTTGPHLVELPHTVAADVAGRGRLTDLTAVLERQPRIDFVEPAGESGRVDGRTIGVPYAFETVALLYNRALVSEPPETADELIERATGHHDPASGSYGLYHPLHHPSYYGAWIHAFGSAVYDAESGSRDLADDGTVAGVEFVADRLSPVSVPDPSASEDLETVFVDGDAPFAVDGPRHAARAVAEGVDVGVAPLPQPDAATRPPRPPVVVDLLSFTARLDEPDERDATAAALEFARWYATNEAVGVREAEERTVVPASADVAASDALPETVAGFVDAARSGRLAPPTSVTRVRYSRLQAAVESVLAEAQSAGDALEAADAGIEGVRNDE